MSDCRVSVIIPAYNREKYVAEAVESALAQTYEDLEVIVVDDGSQDETRAVLAPYVRDRRFRYCYQENAGVSAARNRGIEVSSGRYLAFLDSDDLWESGHVAQLVRALSSTPESWVAFSAVAFFGDADDVWSNNVAFGRSVERCLTRAFERRNAFLVSNAALLATLLEVGFPFRCQAALIDRQLMQQNNLHFDQELSFTEDAHFMIQSAYHTNFVYVEEVGCRVRRHEENDGDLKYTEKKMRNYLLRVGKSKTFFRDKQLTSEERRALNYMLWDLQSQVMWMRCHNRGLWNKVLQSALLLYQAPSTLSVKSVIKLFLGIKER